MADGEGTAAAQGNTEGAEVQTPPVPPGTSAPVMAGPKPEGAQPEGGAPPPAMGEDQARETKSEGDGKTKPEGEAKPEEPIDYFADVKLPEGYQLDQELAPKAAELFGKYKLPKEAAQEFIDFATSMRQKEATLAAQVSQEAQLDSVRKMAAEITSRPEFEKEKPLVQLGIRSLAKDFPEIRAFCNDPVFGNMPEVWKIMLAVGRRFETEGQLLNSGKDTGGAGNFLEGLYDTMKVKK